MVSKTPKKKMNASHINKRIKMLEEEAAEGRAEAKKGRTRALIALAVFFGTMVVYQVITALGFLDMPLEDLMPINILTLGFMSVIAVVGVRFWGRYSRGRKQYKKAEAYLEQYYKLREESK